jgi:hypothetical protein
MATQLTMDVKIMRMPGFTFDPQKMLTTITPHLAKAAGLIVQFDSLRDRRASLAANELVAAASAVIPAVMQSPAELDAALANPTAATGNLRGAVAEVQLRYHPIRRWRRTRRRKRRALKAAAAPTAPAAPAAPSGPAAGSQA